MIYSLAKIPPYALPEPHLIYMEQLHPLFTPESPTSYINKGYQGVIKQIGELFR